MFTKKMTVRQAETCINVCIKTDHYHSRVQCVYQNLPSSQSSSVSVSKTTIITVTFVGSIATVNVVVTAPSPGDTVVVVALGVGWVTRDVLYKHRVHGQIHSPQSNTGSTVKHRVHSQIQGSVKYRVHSQTHPTMVLTIDSQQTMNY
jgi:hypothetical protein